MDSWAAGSSKPRCITMSIPWYPASWSPVSCRHCERQTWMEPSHHTSPSWRRDQRCKDKKTSLAVSTCFQPAHATLWLSHGSSSTHIFFFPPFLPLLMRLFLPASWICIEKLHGNRKAQEPKRFAAWAHRLPSLQSESSNPALAAVKEEEHRRPQELNEQAVSMLKT